MKNNKMLTRIATAAALMFSAGAYAAEPFRIGVLEDMSGLYSDITGRGSVVAAQFAIDDFGGKVLGRPIELLSADHLNKADVASSRAREWYQKDDVKLITGLGNSAVANAVRTVSRSTGKIDIVTSAASSDLTGAQCSPTGFHWAYDSYSLGKTVGSAVVANGGDTWFFIAADYNFGQAVQRDTTAAVTAAGGKVIGSTKMNINSADASSFVLQAQASKAKIVGVATAGGDTITVIKAARDFGLVAGGQRLAVPVIYLTDVFTLGLKTAQGLLLADPFYWDLNPETRAWSARFFKETNKMPTMTQIGVYSAVLHFLKATAEAKTDDPKVVADKIRALPVNDAMGKNVKVREDGRVLRDVHLFQTKTPAESKGPWDLYKLVSTTPGTDAYKSLKEGGCSYIKQ
ncbi:ABC transporter substrate-binding protein [Herbaspirillum sp. alder98]|uniref:ABC transporter substrate-binding protein n=1 Tax=Herbaspirillum sp. alder98 TaxID=2913096 RepID=UPI001CD8DFCD|nr:ABC transporter substrate-binding protein [Herbaspirillum sp. alder98]MCA1326075.1 ABC transporter substrate-binding protein [Herbaspirillum sp. alder98]